MLRISIYRCILFVLCLFLLQDKPSYAQTDLSQLLTRMDQLPEEMQGEILEYLFPDVIDHLVDLMALKTNEKKQWVTRVHQSRMNDAFLSPGSTAVIERSREEMQQLWREYDERDHRALQILMDSRYQLSAAEKWLLYVLCQHPVKSIHLGEVEQAMKRRYGEDVSPIFNLRASFERLPMPLKEIVRECFHIQQDRGWSEKIQGNWCYLW